MPGLAGACPCSSVVGRDKGRGSKLSSWALGTTVSSSNRCRYPAPSSLFAVRPHCNCGRSPDRQQTARIRGAELPSAGAGEAVNASRIRGLEGCQAHFMHPGWEEGVEQRVGMQPNDECCLEDAG